MNAHSKSYIIGNRDMVGLAIHRNLKSKGCHNIITRTHRELDLTNHPDGDTFFELGSYLCISTKLICAGYSKFGKKYG